MKPFIIKFAFIPESSNSYPISEMRYDPDIEQMVCIQANEKTPIIDHASVFSLTASTLTEARVDPTRDEPTDR
jgi:hypothetical protein